MARNQKNFSWFKYLKDNAAEFNIRGEDGGAWTAVDGHATFDAANPSLSGINKRNHPRYAVAQDAATFRTVKGIIYTPTAFAAIDLGDTVSVPVEGSGTNVNYTVVEKIGEKWVGAKASRHLADA